VSGTDAAWLRARRAELVDDTRLRGAAFGAALADAVDAVLRDALGAPVRPNVAVVALGSYARRELCPGSDVDVVLVHEGATDVAALADALWYPLWDAGIVLGHAARTPKESRKLAAQDRDTLTALLDGRVVAGGAPDLGRRVVDDARRHAARDRDALLARLADDARQRQSRPGPVAEMLEPNLKDGAGGLRDLQALQWAGWCHDGPGIGGLVAVGALEHDDVVDLDRARTLLLDARVALHRVTGGRADVLALQEQDAVAAATGHTDADALMRALAGAARQVAWIAADVWSRLVPVRKARRSVPPPVVDGPFVEWDGRLGMARGAMLDGNAVVALARRAAERGLTIDRSALRAARHAPPPTWAPRTRDDFLALLRAGRTAVPTVAALDHGDLMTTVLPEWAGVRAMPQRNAYHRFTVDRHLVETVAEAAALLDDAGVPAAQDLRRPDLLLLGALLHDIAKGRPGDHSEVGAGVARAIAQRLGVDDDGAEVVAWLVRDHLLMADTATRRDLADPATIERFAARVGDPERLRLLTLLTIADSRATGPAAWSASKAALVDELYDRTMAGWRGDVAGAAAEPDDQRLAGPGVVVEWSVIGDGRLRCAVGADDRPGLLADVAGALSLEGFDIDTADGRSLAGGRAAEVFDGTDPLGRLADAEGRERAAATIREVLAGGIAVADGLRARRATYRSAPVDPAAVRVVVMPDESAESIVVEVFAPDAIGLLATLARAFFDAHLDVTTVRASTTGELAVDVFYVRDDGSFAHADRIEALARTLRDALARD
jgi:[protein-PII] uridylyltransferase